MPADCWLNVSHRDILVREEVSSYPDGTRMLTLTFECEQYLHNARRPGPWPGSERRTVTTTSTLVARPGRDYAGPMPPAGTWALGEAHLPEFEASASRKARPNYDGRWAR